MHQILCRFIYTTHARYLQPDSSSSSRCLLPPLIPSLTPDTGTAEWQQIYLYSVDTLQTVDSVIMQMLCRYIQTVDTVYTAVCCGLPSAGTSHHPAHCTISHGVHLCDGVGIISKISRFLYTPETQIKNVKMCVDKYRNIFECYCYVVCISTQQISTYLLV